MQRCRIRVLALAALALTACEGKTGGAKKDEAKPEAAAPAKTPVADHPEIRAGELIVEGSRNGDIILKVVHDHLEEIAACYQQAKKAEPGLAGALGIRFFIKADGSVPDAILHQAEITDRGMQRCLMQVFKTLKFPEGGETRATLPLFFGETVGKAEAAAKAEAAEQAG